MSTELIQRHCKVKNTARKLCKVMKGDGKTEDFPQHRAISLALRLGADLLGNSTGNKNFVELLTYL